MIDETTSKSPMTPEQLHSSIAAVLQSNGYEVESEELLGGHNVGIYATDTDPLFPKTLVIQATVSKVGQSKYGEYLSALVWAQRNIERCQVALVSLDGFAPTIKDTAEEVGVHCWTYLDFRKLFVRTAAFEQKILGTPDQILAQGGDDLPDRPTPLWKQLADLNASYQDPKLTVNESGKETRAESALTWFDEWLRRPPASRPWVSLIGDYGSGKTALTKVLLRRWMKDWQDGGRHLPIRIELKDFATRFSFDGLLVHFWKTNGLDRTLPLATLEELIRQGRAVYLLDGYDEMAQNLSLMDRRNCLVALASAISGNCPGLLTSRPNYFTEAEELRVMDILYSKGSSIHYLDRDVAAREKRLDAFLERYYLERTDAQLDDLDPEQVQALLNFKLSEKPKLRASVQKILNRVYQPEADSVSLAQKPVVVTYLLEIAEDLGTVALKDYEPLDEWGIYKLVMDRLVARDQKRTSGIVMPSERRAFLQDLAIWMTQTGKSEASEDAMRSLVAKRFAREINRLGNTERNSRHETFFADLRSSASLTTSESGNWTFSHNSLREFLVAEALVETIMKTRAAEGRAPRGLRPSQAFNRFLSAAGAHHAQLWSLATGLVSTDPDGYLNLILPSVMGVDGMSAGEALSRLVQGSQIDNVLLEAIDFSGSDFKCWSFQDVAFDRMKFDDAVFENCNFRNVIFSASHLSGARFHNCSFIGDIEFTGVLLDGASFEGSSFRDPPVGAECSISVPQPISESDLWAFLRFTGAQIMEGKHLNVIQFHSMWTDINKISSVLVKDQGWSQYLGLTQRGGIKNVKFARRFVNIMLTNAVLEARAGNTMVRTTNEGRPIILELLQNGVVPSFLQSELS